MSLSLLRRKQLIVWLLTSLLAVTVCALSAFVCRSQQECGLFTVSEPKKGRLPIPKGGNAPSCSWAAGIRVWCSWKLGPLVAVLGSV